MVCLRPKNQDVKPWFEVSAKYCLQTLSLPGTKLTVQRSPEHNLYYSVLTVSHLVIYSAPHKWDICISATQCFLYHGKKTLVNVHHFTNSCSGHPIDQSGIKHIACSPCPPYLFSQSSPAQKCEASKEPFYHKHLEILGFLGGPHSTTSYDLGNCWNFCLSSGTWRRKNLPLCSISDHFLFRLHLHI